MIEYCPEHGPTISVSSLCPDCGRRLSPRPWHGSVVIRDDCGPQPDPSPIALAPDVDSPCGPVQPAVPMDSPAPHSPERAGGKPRTAPNSPARGTGPDAGTSRESIAVPQPDLSREDGGLWSRGEVTTDEEDADAA